MAHIVNIQNYFVVYLMSKNQEISTYEPFLLFSLTDYK